MKTRVHRIPNAYVAVPGKAPAVIGRDRVDGDPGVVLRLLLFRFGANEDRQAGAGAVVGALEGVAASDSSVRFPCDRDGRDLLGRI